VPSGSGKVGGLNNLTKEDKRTVENHFDQELKRKRELDDEVAHEEVLFLSCFPSLLHHPFNLSILFPFTGCEKT
jgi:hypothetical protein